MRRQKKYEYRRLLPDRVRLTVTPRYTDYTDAFPNHEEQSKSAKRLHRQAKIKGFKVVRPHGRPYIEIPNYYNYIGHVMLSTFRMHTIQMEFNVIRYLNDKLERELFLEHDSAYFEKIKIHDNNYTLFCNSDITRVYDKYVPYIPELVTKVAGVTFSQLCPLRFVYKNVTISQAEFNIDIYVGDNKSWTIMQNLVRYLQSPEGLKWRMDSVSDVVSHVTVAASDKFDVDEHPNSLSVRFNIAKGIILKFYTKTSNHIRCEIIFYKDFMMSKYRRRAWWFIYGRLFKDADRILKGLGIPQKLKEIEDFDYTIGLDVRDHCVEILENIQDGMSQLLDAKLYSGVVDTPEGIACIRRYPQFKEEFYLDYDTYGKKLYKYNPEKAKEKQENRRNVRRMYNHKGKMTEEMQCMLEK